MSPRRPEPPFNLGEQRPLTVGRRLATQSSHSGQFDATDLDPFALDLLRTWIYTVVGAGRVFRRPEREANTRTYLKTA
jgi:hypothetical protein